eukprot:1677084-Alexandrium_andersonii.AAC.1
MCIRDRGGGQRHGGEDPARPGHAGEARELQARVQGRQARAARHAAPAGPHLRKERAGRLRAGIHAGTEARGEQQQQRAAFP